MSLDTTRITPAAVRERLRSALAERHCASEMRWLEPFVDRLAQVNQQTAGVDEAGVTRQTLQVIQDASPPTEGGDAMLEEVDRRDRATGIAVGALADLRRQLGATA